MIQEGEFERIGGARPLRVDVRLVAATNRDLAAEVAAGRFRADLYYRLNVFPIRLPPLRERRDDIPALVRHFAALTARRLGRPLEGVGTGFIEAAGRYDWPGNIRELENVVERALITSRDGRLDAFTPPAASPAATGSAPAQFHGRTLEEVERDHLRATLDALRWQIEGEDGAARVLGLNPSTLRGRLRKLGLRKPG